MTQTPTQQLIPGFIGMSVFTDCIYLQEANRDPDPEGRSQTSALVSVLRTMNFRQLTDDFNAGHRDRVEQALGEAIEAVQQAGADFLVLTANTMHAMLASMGQVLRIPVLDITDAVISAALERGHRRLGLLGTLGTLRSGIYGETARQRGVEVVHPTDELAAAVDRAIFARLVRGVTGDEDAELVLEAVRWFAKQDVDAVILGCTDLSLLVDHLEGSVLPLLDSTRIHARAARQWAFTSAGP